MRAGRDTSAAWRVRATAVLAALLMALGASTPAIATEAPEASSARAHTVVDSGAEPEASEGSVATASLAGFRPGNIISDEVFYHVDSMSASGIDALIRAKSPNCRSADGVTCLKDYSATTYTFPGDKYCSGYKSDGRESAATMIHKAAVACGINPQVLIVTLEKEQSLVTRARSTTTYARAMGFGCPDNVGGVCDPAYAGFHVQVYYAARQFQVYEKATTSSGRPYFTQYAPGGYRTIRFHPTASCGSSSVYIENQATANLYYYTPYQPNEAALAAGYGSGDTCSAYGNRNFYNLFTDWFGSTGQREVSPVGAVDSWTPVAGGVRVSGWAVDPESNKALSIRVKAGSTLAGRVTANQPSEAAQDRFPWYGPNHGFSAVIDMPADGGEVCVVANNIGAGSNRTLGCRDIRPLGGSPFGATTTFQPIAGGVRVRGWVLDPDTSGAVTVRVKSADTLLARLVANRASSTVASSYPAYGTDHAFEANIPLAPGEQTICIAANNIGVGSNRTLGCETLAPLGGSAVGVVEAVEPMPGGINIRGWAIDPDTTGPVTIRVKSGSTIVARIVADEHRDDVAADYVAFGGAHGFDAFVPLAPGQQNVCAVANAIGVGGHRTLGCETIAPASGSPVGYLSSVTAAPGGATISGWAVDPDTTGPVTVRFKVGAQLVARTVASSERRDLGARFPGYGSAHAFTVFVPLPNGPQTVCAVANNIGGGSHASIGCRSADALSGDPFGYINTATAVDGGIYVKGWAIDPDTTEPVTIRIKSGSQQIARFTADSIRNDLLAKYPAYGAAHGFQRHLDLPPGSYSVCAVVNNVGAGVNRSIGCRQVVVS